MRTVNPSTNIVKYKTSSQRDATENYLRATLLEDLHVTEKQANLSQRLKSWGFTRGHQMRLYGEVFDLVSEPIFVADNIVVVDATEKKSGKSRVVPLPLPIVNMARAA
jgi:hypothetical protein